VCVGSGAVERTDVVVEVALAADACVLRDKVNGE
jgi:hypothetical protein